MVDIENPGVALRRFTLAAPVVSCVEAAEAKGIDLERELKSLLIVTSTGPVLVHIRGNRRLSLRAIKRLLSVDEARLAPASDLQELGLAPGTVSPFASTLWAMRQLVTREILRLAWVTTNAGISDAYVMFEPAILLQAPTISVGDFEL